MFETIEAKFIDREKIKSPEDVNGKEIFREVERLLDSKENLIGIGRTAEVHFLHVNEEHCWKIISKHEKAGKGTVAFSDTGSRPEYHPVHVEAQFLADLQGVSAHARVPVPYYALTKETDSENDEPYEHSETSILAMEKLNAVSLEDVLRRNVAMPEKFDKKGYFEKLRGFFEDMHNRKGIHHRDAHIGNLMIDNLTGEPYVIDFGSATYGRSEDVYSEERARETVRYIPDIDHLDKAEKEVTKYLYELTDSV